MFAFSTWYLSDQESISMYRAQFHLYNEMIKMYAPWGSSEYPNCDFNEHTYVLYVIPSDPCEYSEMLVMYIIQNWKKYLWIWFWQL